jgi:hypothetical protein
MSVTLQYINTGSSANAGDGDSLRTAFNKINSNFITLSTQSGSTSSIVGPATTSTLGGVKIGSGLAVAPDGTISTTGTSTSALISLLDQNNNLSIDTASYSGSTTLPATSFVNMFSFDRTVYRSATVEISANNTANDTDDIGSYSVVWTNYVAKAVGLGSLALDNLGNTGNAEWEITANNLGNNINISMYNAAGTSANGHVITWRAKVNLFRL